ncbi:hypothetical protein QBC34DRAFT_419354 [Podospora aff. communis PSN243]|uniref:F-box domain-containing protein n=1 Tax=Podospora aff. communis PSN243 TaxID=3040156 RepID=A0AAV9G4E2_9PEZI|nr:hypothetical protein QBC34DRAFT_419354 [Podospora aff. communis PSN243]
MTKSKKREKARQQEAQKAIQKNTAAPDDTPPTPSPARDKVLATPELLELILLNIDIAPLLTTVQRVSKSWHALIAASAALQQHLFFKPIPSTPFPSSPPLPSPYRKFNPLLYKNFPNFFPYDPEDMHRSRDGRNRITRRPAPPTREGIVSADFQVQYMTWAVEKEKMLPIADIRNGGVKHYAFTRKGASWRRMLVAQPPPVRVARLGDFAKCEIFEGLAPLFGGSGDVVTLDARVPDRVLDKVEKRMVVLEGGLRMGDLLDEMWTVEFGRAYPSWEPVAWCAWRVPEEVRTVEWAYAGLSTPWEGRYRMPVTRVGRWTDGADVVIGGFIPRPCEMYSDTPCELCTGSEGKFTKRCKVHLMKQQRYRCQEYRAKGVLSLNPSP